MNQPRLPGRTRSATVVAAALLTASAVHGGSSLPLRLNWTSSAPIGLYREVPGSPGRGDLALVCLPSNLEVVGRSRGYLPAGGCRSGGSPILKQVVALPGDEVDVQRSSFAVNGRLLDRSELRDVDTLGRQLDHVPLGRRMVSNGEAWVLGVHRERSWDSRYFGPIPTESIVGRVEPLLVLRQAHD